MELLRAHHMLPAISVLPWFPQLSIETVARHCFPPAAAPLYCFTVSRFLTVADSCNTPKQNHSSDEYEWKFQFKHVAASFSGVYRSNCTMLLLEQSRESISVDAPVSGHGVDAGVDTADIDPDESLD